jgi:hypothetical protein
MLHLIVLRVCTYCRYDAIPQDSYALFHSNDLKYVYGYLADCTTTIHAVICRYRSYCLRARRKSLLGMLGMRFTRMRKMSRRVTSCY